MSKRVLSNISNIHCQPSKAKRALLSPGKVVKKRVKQAVQDENFCSLDEKQTSKLKNDENVLYDPTKSIEKRVRTMAIGSKSKFEDDSLEISNIDDISFNASSEEKPEGVDFSDPLTYYVPPKDLPEAVEDFDKTQIKTIESEPHYTRDVFEYYRSQEDVVLTKRYLHDQLELTKGMRSVLVDWMVEVQESFELNHETLYLGVKLVDHYLMKQKITKLQFQLLGATALFIAAKFDERIPPAIEDFLYICDDAYSRRDIIQMEMKMLRTLNFYLGFPLSYTFLRRYARCGKLSMETLTLARFILEMSLMEYELIEEKDSQVAAAALLLALKMKGEDWTDTLKYYSNYEENSLTTIMYRLNDLISNTQSKMKTIRIKYSHKIFFEVAKMSPLKIK